MFWRPPDEKELSAFGLKVDDYDESVADVWPENWPAIDLYVKYRTQWIQGAGGPTGLNYVVLFDDLDRNGVEGEDRDRIMDGIRVIEDAVLDDVYKSM